MVETGETFDDHIRRLKEQGEDPFSDFQTLVDTISQSFSFGYDIYDAIGKVHESTPGKARSQAITAVVEDFFARVREYKTAGMAFLSPGSREERFEKEEVNPGYVRALHMLAHSFEHQLFARGARLAEGLYFGHPDLADYSQAEPQATIEAFQDYVLTHDGEQESDVAARLFDLKMFETVELPLSTREGKRVIRYWARDIIIPETIPEIKTVKELVNAHSVFIETDEGAFIMNVPLDGTGRDDLIPGTVVTAEEYDANYSFGEPVTSGEIKEYLDDIQFQGMVSDYFFGGLNLNVLPLYGRIRLMQCYKDPGFSDTALTFFATHGEAGIQLFNILSVSELKRVIPALNRLSQTPFRVHSAGVVRDTRMDTEVVQHIAAIARNAPLHIGMNSIKMRPVLNLLEKRLHAQIMELCDFVEKSKETDEGTFDLQTQEDLDFMANAFPMLGGVAVSTARLSGGQSIPVEYEKRHMPPDFILDVYDFAERHPDMPATYQALEEFVQLVMMAQEEAPVIHQMEAGKPEMYRKLRKQNKLEEVPTTETETDTARAISILEHCVQEGKLPLNMKILFVGMNTAQRFEKVVVEEMRKKGVVFKEIVGIDQNDFEAEARTNLGIQAGDGFKYLAGNLQEDAFPELETEEGNMDVIVFPWSMLNDLLKTTSFAQVLYKTTKYAKKGAVIIVDVPFPAGEHSYEAAIHEHKSSLPFGHVFKTLKGADEDIQTAFNIHFLQALTTHFISLGLEPLNFPASIAEQTRLAKEISDDDSELVARHERGEDKDAMQYPVYYAGANRMTLAVQLKGVEELMKKTGMFPMMLYERVIKQKELDTVA